MFAINRNLISGFMFSAFNKGTCITKTGCVILMQFLMVAVKDSQRSVDKKAQTTKLM